MAINGDCQTEEMATRQREKKKEQWENETRFLFFSNVYFDFGCKNFIKWKYMNVWSPALFERFSIHIVYDVRSGCLFVYLKYFLWFSIFSHYFSPHNKHTLPIILINGTQIIQFIFIWIIKTTFVSLLAAIGPKCARSLTRLLTRRRCVYLFVSKGIADFGTKCLQL